MLRLSSILLTIAMAAGTASAYDLAGAIRSAKAGDVLHVPAGTYYGCFDIDKPITLVADGAAILDGNGAGDVVRIKSPDVTVRGFIIRHTGINLDRENAAVVSFAPRTTIEDNRIEDALFGVSFRGAKDSVLRHNEISGKIELPIPRRGDGIKIWSCDGMLVENNHVHDCCDVVMWYSAHLTVRGNRIERCRYGIHFMYAGQATVERNDVRDNSVGIFLMYAQDLVLNQNVIAHNRGPSGFGLGLKDVNGMECHDNVFADNRVGLHVDHSPEREDTIHTFRKNVFAYNDIALGFMPSCFNNQFVENSLFDNIEQVCVFGGGQLEGNAFTVAGRGNYWSDYRGFDANHDGKGDVEYRAQSIFENLMDRQPKMRLFLFSPAQQAVELASRAFPVVKPQIRATDTAPLMRPVAADAPAVVDARSHGFSPAALLVSAGLLAAGALVVRSGLQEMGR